MRTTTSSTPGNIIGRRRPETLLWTVLALCALATSLVSSSSEAEIVRREKVLYDFPLVEGAHVIYDTTQTYGFYEYYGKPAEYTTRIRIHEVIGSQVRFEWWMEGHDVDQSLDTHGFSTIRGLAEGRVLDPWWTDGEDMIKDRCELWISQRAFDELHSFQQTRFKVDTVARGDIDTVLFLVGLGTFPVTINGDLVDLPVLILKSNHDDSLMVYNNRDNPFVLSADLPNISHWDVVEIQLPSDY